MIVERTTGSQHSDAQKVTGGGTNCGDGRPDPIRACAEPRRSIRGRPGPRTRPSNGSSPMVSQYVRFGSSPRGAQALLLASKVVALLDGRPSVSVDDIRSVAPGALRHRIGLSYEAAVDDVNAEHVIDDLLATVQTRTVSV